MTHTSPSPSMQHILPNNATLFERTLAGQVDNLLALDLERMRNLWNPWTCHPDDLAYLAWTMSVDIWDPQWPLLKRRSVVANALKHHALKGTLGGLSVYAELVDAKITKAVTPPAKVFSGASLTRAQREAWLQRLPQVRVWRQYERGTAGRRMFFGGAKRPSFLSVDDAAGSYHPGFPHPNDAITRLQRRARWIEGGLETDSRVENWDTGFRVFKTGLQPHAVFFGFRQHKLPRKRFYMPSTAHTRVVTIESLSVSAWRRPVGPSLLAVTSEPEIVAVRSKEGHAVYAGRDHYTHNRFYLPSTAQYRLYERYAVNDGSTFARNRPTVQFMGVGRYGIKPHTAELKIEIRGKRPVWQAGEGVVGPLHQPRFWMPHNPSALRRTRQALIAAKRRTDQILLDTTTKPGFIAGLPFWAGDDVYRV